MLSLQRTRAHAGLIVGLLGVVALVAGLLSGMAGFVAASALDGARTILASAPDDAGGVLVGIRLTADGAEAQDAAVRQGIAEQLGGAPLVIVRTVVSEGIRLQGSGTRALLLSDATIAQRAALDEGAWPSAPGQTALQADAAALLGLVTGDVVAVPAADGQSIDLEIVGLWRATDPRAVDWLADPLVARGGDGRTVGPFVIVEQQWAAIETRPIARWSVAPDAASIRPPQIDAIARGLPELAGALDDDPRTGGSGVTVDGGLAVTIAQLQRAAVAVSGITPVPIVLIVGVGLAAILELARLLVGVRRDESALLRSRGASARDLTLAAAAEWLVISVPAAVVGALIGALVADGAPDPLVVAPIALAVAASASAVGVIVTARDARTPLRRDTLTDSGRGRRVAGLGLLVGALAAAGVSVGQFRLYGSPLVPTVDGGLAVDPLAVLAPTLALGATAVVAVALLEPLARLAARAGRRRTALAPALAARQVARRAAVYATPVLLLSLAVGGLGVAAAYDATWSRSGLAARQLTLGADVRVTAVTLDAATRGALAGLASSMPVLAADLQLGDDAVSLLALDAASLAGVASPASGAVGGPAIAAALGADQASSVDALAVIVPSGTTALTAQLTTTPADAAVDVAFWLIDSAGAVERAVAGAPLPWGAEWRLLAIDLTPRGAVGAIDIVVDAVIAQSAAGESPLAPTEQWSPQPDASPEYAGTISPLDGLPAGAVGGARLDLSRPPLGPVRIMPPPLVPDWVISTALANRTALEVGDSVTARVAATGRTVSGVVTAIVPAIPGTGEPLSAVVDLAVFTQQQLATTNSALRATEVWLSAPASSSGDAPSAATAVALLAEQARVAAPAGARIAATTDRGADALLSAARVALWIGAIGGAALALAAIAALARSLLRSRAEDIVVLRALGQTPRAQALGRARELGAVLGVAVVTGGVGASIVAALTVSDLARAAIPDAPPGLPTALALDATTLAAVGASLLAAIALLVLVHCLQVARQARLLVAREVLR